MATKISKGLKWTFFVHSILTLFFGLVFTMLVNFYLEIIGWPYFDPIMLQLFGFTSYAFSLSSFIAWKETEWEKVKTIVIMEIAWFMGGVHVMFWWLYAYLKTPFPFPLMGWVYLIIFSAFLITFIVFYIQHEKKNKSEPNR
ncbi:MAG: hypothetical protein ACFFCG_11885 [Promethearchaeota archaeon]